MSNQSLIRMQFEGALAEWVTRSLKTSLDGVITLTLARDSDGATIQVEVSPPGHRGECLAATPVGDVSYARVEGIGDADAAGVVRTFAEDLGSGRIALAQAFPHLIAKKVDEDASARAALAAVVLGPDRQLTGEVEGGGAEAGLPALRQTVFLDPPGIAELLSPELVVDGPAPLGFSLRAIYLPPVARRQNLDFRQWIAEFHRGDDDRYVQLVIGTADVVSGGGYGTRAGLAVAPKGVAEGQPPVEASVLTSWLSGLLALKLPPGAELKIPSSVDELRAMSVPQDRLPEGDELGSTHTGEGGAEVRTPPALNLAIDAECGQACVFCSVKTFIPPRDGGEDELETIKGQLHVAQTQGVKEVRLNGIDPLGFSRILDVVGAVGRMGFEKLSVYSTGRRLADEGFLNTFLERAPENVHIVMPLYGIEAAVHDAVVGLPGAFDAVSRALELLLARLRPDQVAISTVVVRQNLHQFGDLCAFAESRNIEFETHLPYPMRQTRRDPYGESALPEQEIITAVVKDLSRHPESLRGFILRRLAACMPHPCLLFQAEQSLGLPALGNADRLDDTSEHRLDGTHYRGDEFTHGDVSGGGDDAFAVATLPCPEADTCALAPSCTREHYAVYKERFGLEAFKAVRPGDLYRLKPPNAGL